MYGNGLLIFYEKRTWTSRFRSSGKEMGVAGAGGTRRPSLFNIEAIMCTYLTLTMPLYFEPAPFKYNLGLSLNHE